MPMHREWVDLGFNALLVATGFQIVPLDILFDMREVVNKTVTRLIIGFDVDAPDPDENDVFVMRMNFGIGVATREAFDAGVASVPSLAATTEFPIHGWLWRSQYTVSFSNSATFGIELYKFPRIDKDIRAARKVDKGVLYFAAVNTVIQGANSVQLGGMIRALVLIG